MEKYLAKLMFNINIDNGNDASQFDEQIRIIESPSLEEAFYKARVIGKKEEEVWYGRTSINSFILKSFEF